MIMDELIISINCYIKYDKKQKFINNLTKN